LILLILLNLDANDLTKIIYFTKSIPLLNLEFDTAFEIVYFKRN